MELKKTCDICGRTFKVSEFQAMCEQYGEIKVRVENEAGYITDQKRFDTCHDCARQVLNKIYEMKRQSTTKCFWCEHDFGPNHPNYRKGCDGCIVYSNFQLKKRMSPTQLAHWKYFNGDD